MNDRKVFAEKISLMDLTRAEQATAFLWFYRHTQTYEERTASELAGDLADEGLGRPNVTTLNKDLTKSKQTVKGKRPKTFQLYTKFLVELNAKYEPFLNINEVKVSPSVLPFEIFQGTRIYLEKIVKQINGSYDYGFYDASAVQIRRLMESLIIEVFIHKQIADEIKLNGSFLMLEKLISKITNHTQIHLGRNTPKAMENIKRLGDTAAHDRTYITQQQDINDMKPEIRRTIQELLDLAGIKPVIQPILNL